METNKINSGRFYAHHVGGRAGSVGFPHLPKFSQEIVNVIYDADESCIEQVKETWYGKQTIILPYCLSNKFGTSELNINYDPYTSSLLPTNPDFGNFYISNQEKNSDYRLAETLRTERTIEVITHTLDSLVETNVVPQPDFLSIDTQGSELWILEGASKCLCETIVAVQVEINFASIYQGVPLFGKLDEFLRNYNFLLVDIKPFKFGYKRIGLSCRGSKIPLQGEALYLLRPDSIERFDNTFNLAMKLEKLAFAALAFGYTDVAFGALERSYSLIPNMPVPPDANRTTALYQMFLLEFFEEVRKYTDIPLLWHDVFSSFEESNNRFKSSNQLVDEEKPETVIIHHGFIKRLWSQSLRYFSTVIEKFSRKVRRICYAVAKKSLTKLGLKISFVSKITRFDSFLLENGFNIAVDCIHNERKSKRY
jgi:FkbM family methyltransferase